ncbi:MAG TPA: YbaL family putative K(+) efflux transporter [Devosia sp.]|nr:YbaL family putative K(+) efflux transporter [Devosia sp.]
MPHDTPLISTIVGALVLAFLLGALANRLKLPPLVGYLIAGIFVGPHTPGFVADESLARELSEIGVILLMFGVGLHFSLKDLVSVRAIAVPGAIAQIGGATLLGLGLATLLGWTLGGGLLFGLALSVASTVVLIKALQERHMLQSERGRIAVGWLIVEDLAMVLALVLVPALATAAGSSGGHSADPIVNALESALPFELGLPGILALTVVKIGLFVGVMLVVGRRLIPLALHYTAHTGSRELFRLAVLAIALGVAAGAAYLFGVSLALGAFFAGMILSESELSHRAAEETLPLRDAFAVLFFVSVGMLFDPTILFRDPLPILATVLIIVIGKSVLAFGIVRLFRMPVGTAIIVAVSLAQVGEFSFILAELGVSLGILPEAGRDFILAGAIVSIILNPLAFWAAEHLLARDAPAAKPEATSQPDSSVTQATGAAPGDMPRPTDHTIVVGYGRVGSVIAGRFLRLGLPLVVIEDGEEPANAARKAGIYLVEGNAVDPDILQRAGIASARNLHVAIPNSFEAGQVIEQARRANGALVIAVRAHSEEEADYLKGLGADHVIMGEREIALGMLARFEGEAD